MKGLTNVKPYFDIPPYISIVTEIEILGVNGIKDDEIKIREIAIEYCSLIPITNAIKRKAIEIKRDLKIAIPDGLIAATAIEENLQLVTADKGFKRIKELSLMLIKV